MPSFLPLTKNTAVHLMDSIQHFYVQVTLFIFQQKHQMRKNSRLCIKKFSKILFVNLTQKYISQNSIFLVSVGHRRHFRSTEVKQKPHFLSFGWWKIRGTVAAVTDLLASLFGVRQLLERYLLQSSPAFLYSSLFWVSIFSASQAYQLLLKVTHATWNFIYKGHDSYSHCGIPKLPTGEIHNECLTGHHSPKGQAGPGHKLIISDHLYHRKGSTLFSLE